MEFKDRKQEVKEIKSILDSKRFEFLVLYGRRRVGKTELVLHTTKNKKRIYYLATTEKNLERFYQTCIDFDPYVANLKQDFEVLFDYIKDRAEVIIIDEFQNLIKENKGIISILQAIVDTKLNDSKVKLILLGSSVSIISSKVLSYQSPLYGRKTASIKLKPVSFFDLGEFFPDSNAEELVEIFGFADGVPFYLIKIEEEFWKWLKKEFNEGKSFIKDEVDFLVRYEFDNPSTYKLILEAIANGKTTLNEIKGFIKVERTDLSPYLGNLIEVELIKREVPFGENANSRFGRYYLKDNFLRFWFRFVYPNSSSIEEGVFDTAIIKKEYNNYLGFIFEEVSKQFLIRNKFFDFLKFGRWWFKDNEIDIIATGKDEKSILFGECKWQDMVDSEKIVKDCAEKAVNVKWGEAGRKESFAVFARSFSKRIDSFNGKKVYCFDLKDIGRILKK